MITSQTTTVRKVPIIGVAVMTIGLAGCVSPDTSKLVARTASTAFYEITVNFDADRCPVSVTPPVQTGCSAGPTGICVDPGRAVRWVSDPVGTPFEVYFNPFVGRPYASRPPDESTRPIIVRRDALEGEYKYAIFGVACSGPNPVLDPAFRVNPRS